MTFVELTKEDEVKIRQAVRMLEMRRSNSLLAVLAAERKLKDVPERILTLAKERFEKGEGATPVDPVGPVPSTDHLGDVETILMAEVMDKTTVKDAVLQIYDNMHKRTGWRYNASETNVVGAKYLDGSMSVGMCESYRNAFKDALLLFDRLRRTHPVEAVRVGSLDIEPSDALVADRFCTRTGLTLMGGLKGNVYLEVDGTGAPAGTSVEDVNRFVFKGHWSLKVNGVEYDPIFYSVGEENIQYMLNKDYEVGTVKFIPNVKAPIPSGEFGATFILVTDWAAFKETADAMIQLYKDNKKEVDDVVSGKKDVQEGTFSKTDRKVYTAAQKLAQGVSDPATFARVVAEGTAVFRVSDAAAVNQVLALAAM